MTENMVDVLIYLYEHFMDEEEGQELSTEGQLEMELAQVGFSRHEIEQALSWLDDLTSDVTQTQYVETTTNSVRIFTQAEQLKLDVELRGFLVKLEQSGILDHQSRELVIDRLLAMDHVPISVEEAQWVVLLVLMNRPGCEDAFMQIEEMVYGNELNLMN